MTSAHDNMLEWTKKVSERIREITKPLAEIIGPGSELRRLAEALPAVAARFQSMSRVVRDACVHAGLPPCRFLSVEAWKEIESAQHNGGNDAAAAAAYRVSKAAIEDTETREGMLNDWRANSIVRTRIDILEQALKAHDLQLYSVSIPPFLAHIEGIIADRKHPPDETRNPQFHELKAYVRQLAAEDDLMGVFVSDFVANTVFEKFERGVERPSFSRHAILHGFDTAYGSEVNSVKAILIFDYLQDLVMDDLRATTE